MKFSMGKRSWFSVCILFFFTAFITMIISIAGSSSDYNPINEVYFFEADIKSINASKVVPQIAPILTVLGTALSSPNVTLDDVFGAFENIANSTALTPLLTVLSNSTNTSATLEALTHLAPLASAANSTALVGPQIATIQSLIANSKNGTATFDSLETLVGSSLTAVQQNNTQNLASQQVVFSLLQDSSNVTESTQDLEVLNNLTLTQKASISPLFGVISNSTNQTATFTALAGIANSTIPESLATTLFENLDQVNTTQQLNQTLSALTSLAPGNTALESLIAILSASSTPLQTLKVIENLYKSNVTSQEWAQTSLTSLTSLVALSSNKTAVLSSVQRLSTNLDTTTTSAQLSALDQLFVNSNNATQTLNTIVSLQSALDPSSPVIAYVPYLFELLGASSAPMTTVSSLIEIVEWAAFNVAVFSPIVEILEEASSIQPITEEALIEITPELLDYLHVPVYYRLSFFSLCHDTLHRDDKKCKIMRPVQDLDFRSIIYTALADSQFDPYLKALNIGPDDLHLEGHLLEKQHQYVPAIKATLAMSILSFIFSFFGMFIFGYLMFKTLINKNWWTLATSWAVFTCIFTGLAAAIITAIVNIIKHGTAQDKYGVILTAGPGYYGCVWTAFVLTVFICTIIFFMSVVSLKKQRSMITTTSSESESNDEEKHLPHVDVTNMSNSNSNTNSLGDSDSVVEAPKHAAA